MNKQNNKQRIGNKVKRIENIKGNEKNKYLMKTLKTRQYFMNLYNTYTIVCTINYITIEY